MPESYLGLFRSIHDVMCAEDLLRRAGVRFELVPVPTSISSQCGMALELAADEVPAALRILGPAGILPLRITRREASGAFEEVDLDDLMSGRAES